MAILVLEFSHQAKESCELPKCWGCRAACLDSQLTAAFKEPRTPLAKCLRGKGLESARACRHAHRRPFVARSVPTSLLPRVGWHRVRLKDSLVLRCEE
eukprot:6204213-Pleurochrysis_carterae.AAC.3